MSLTHEKAFEDDLVAHLTTHGWLEGHPSGYNQRLALYPEDVLGWIQDTQPQELEKVKKLSGANFEGALLERLAQELDREGSLKVLRRGFKQINARFEMVQFKPSHGLNPQTLERYRRVRCRVVRQVRYSEHNGNSIDLVLFVNGIPTATLELKTDFSQTIEDAIRQYREDRPVRDPQSRKTEPLLEFRRRALVHFAVSTDEVQMTTQLEGPQTRFLPFNRGNAGGKGNPPNPSGYRTAYLWEQVLERGQWLEILGSYLHLEKQEKTDKDGTVKLREALIFPRYHQLEAVGRLIGAARAEGAGQRYLIQHSAGSGKSNSIAWLAHRLSSLHTDADEKVFNTVLVITDRTVLDQQLQETVYQFEHPEGVVVGLRDRSGTSKTEQFTEALLGRAPIILLTLQTFPAFLSFVREVAALEDGQLEAYFEKHTGKKKRSKEDLERLRRLRAYRYAVIADEAHSSQSGEAAGDLAKVLSSAALDTAEALTPEDVMLADMEARAEHPNLSYFAFTATPKAKTLERFGRPPHPDQPPGEGNLPEPFSVYTMQQAIEEGFILDVLRNFTPYKLAFKLAHGGQEYDEVQVDQSRALQALLGWVRLHPYNISQKVKIIVEHFREAVQGLLEGRAKAMIVTASRKEAVRYKLAVDKYILEQGYTLGTLVAFSGSVSDPESGPQEFSESNMNPGLRGQDIRAAFDTDTYALLIVANKFQTGFSQSLLCAMYVDKRLDGLTAVQTLSRLNRTHPGKDRTYILDFVNSGEDILAAFRPYHRTAELGGVTDPNLIHTLQNKLDEAGIYLASEVDALARAALAPQARQQTLQALLTPAVQRFRVRWQDAQTALDKAATDALEVFRKDIGSFVRLYDFLSQILNYADTDLEKRALFFRLLEPLLRTQRTGETLDLSGVQLTHHRLRHGSEAALNLGGTGAEGATLAPVTAVGSGSAHDPKQAQLAEIIAQMNTLFEGELSGADFIGYVEHIKEKMLESEALSEQARYNTKEQFALGDFREVLMKSVVTGLGSYSSMAKQVLSQPQVREGLSKVLLDLVYDTFAERRAGPDLPKD